MWLVTFTFFFFFPSLIFRNSRLNDTNKIVHFGSVYSLGLSHSDQNDIGKDLSLGLRLPSHAELTCGFCLFCLEQQRRGLGWGRHKERARKRRLEEKPLENYSSIKQILQVRNNFLKIRRTYIGSVAQEVYCTVSYCHFEKLS